MHVCATSFAMREEPLSINIVAPVRCYVFVNQVIDVHDWVDVVYLSRPTESDCIGVCSGRVYRTDLIDRGRHDQVIVFMC